MNAKKIIDGELHTRESIIKKYNKLVHKHAHKLSGDHEQEDLVSEGFIGLILAFDRYDPESDFKFGTFAHHNVRGRMLNLTRRSTSNAHCPHEIVSLAWVMQREELVSVDPEIVAKKLSKPVEHIRRALLYLHTRSVERFDAPLGDNDMEKMTLGDVEGSYDDKSTLIVADFLEKVSERDKVIVAELTLGKTQAEISKLIGVSQYHVSRLRKEIQRKYHEYQRGAL